MTGHAERHRAHDERRVQVAQHDVRHGPQEREGGAAMDARLDVLVALAAGLDQLLHELGRP